MADDSVGGGFSSTPPETEEIDEEEHQTPESTTNQTTFDSDTDDDVDGDDVGNAMDDDIDSDVDDNDVDGNTGRSSDQDEGDESSGEHSASTSDVPDDVRQYDRFKKIDGTRYERANQFLRDRTYITAREWALARLCADFRTETGVEMTKIGNNLPDLVPFMEDTYSPQAVNQARAAFEEKIRTAGATFLYGAMCDFFTAEELDDIMYESTEVAKFLLEIEGVDISVETELEAEERVSNVMREVRKASAELREEELEEQNDS
uniref:DUF5806 family protein n=2 Tax=Halocatena marina TaxID=2934937 RepID=UPI00200E8266|nr:DUF5806 family protein [Halocatena marina]